MYLDQIGSITGFLMYFILNGFSGGNKFGGKTEGCR